MNEAADKQRGPEAGAVPPESHPDQKPAAQAESARRPEPSPKAVRRSRWGGVLVLLVVALGAAFLAWREHSRVNGMRNDIAAEKKKGALVETVRVGLAPDEMHLTLQGESRPYVEAVLFAKVSGYLKEIRVDRGSRVKTGDVLAVIDAPETEQAYVSALSEYRNRAKIAARYRALVKQELVSPQEAEQAFTAADVARANLRTQEQQRSYETLRAPFDGVVTDRMVDPGDLVPDASNSKSGPLAVLTVSDVSRLKVTAYVDQKYAPYVHEGQAVSLFLPERMDEKFPGTVARAAGALDRETRMLLTEVDFDNQAGKIVPGSFVQVELTLPRPSFFTVPVEALVLKDGDPAVAKVGDDKHLHFTKVEVAENDGSNLTLANGVTEGEVLALNVGESIRDGDLVRPVGAGAEGARGSGQPSGGGEGASEGKAGGNGGQGDQAAGGSSEQGGAKQGNLPKLSPSERPNPLDQQAGSQKSGAALPQAKKEGAQ